MSATVGVSVVVCAHNAAQRLPVMLSYLAKQQGCPIPWEVLLVDNASADGTAEAARACWPVNPPAPIRIVREDELGLAAARRCGIREAAYEFVSFVDDDNWLAPDWAARVAMLMRSMPQVGALGGFIDAASETSLPEWFEQFQGAYAVGSQAEESGDVTWSRGYLWGAGLTLRRSAILELWSKGFQSRLMGRKGNTLSAGEDSELCYALRLAGWALWYDAELRLTHFMPTPRLRWNYSQNMWKGFGRASVVLDSYIAAVYPPTSRIGRLRQSWLWQTADALRKAFWTNHSLRAWLKGEPHSQHHLHSAYYSARAAELLRMRSAYDKALQEVRQARWVKVR